jgi:hypothetical protein
MSMIKSTTEVGEPRNVKNYREKRILLEEGIPHKN